MTSVVDLVNHVIFSSIAESQFLHFVRAVLLFYSTEEKSFARIVISVVDLVNHVIFTPIQQCSVLLSVENRSPRGRVGKKFQAFF